jgi:hypothetical protein
MPFSPADGIMLLGFFVEGIFRNSRKVEYFFVTPTFSISDHGRPVLGDSVRLKAALATVPLFILTAFCDVALGSLGIHEIQQRRHMAEFLQYLSGHAL